MLIDLGGQLQSLSLKEIMLCTGLLIVCMHWHTCCLYGLSCVVYGENENFLCEDHLVNSDYQ